MNSPDDRNAVAQQLAEEVLTRHRSHLRALRIEVIEGGVVLHGTATTYYGKQVAFHEVIRAKRFAVVANLIEVQERLSELPTG